MIKVIISMLASSDRETLSRAVDLKHYTTICSSAPSEILAIMALRSRETILERQRKRLARNVATLDEFFGQRPEIFTWKRPLGSSVCFPAMPAAPDTAAFCEELVREAGILLAPSALFQYGHNHVRIGFGRENLPEVAGPVRGLPGSTIPVTPRYCPRKPSREGSWGKRSRPTQSLEA